MDSTILSKMCSTCKINWSIDHFYVNDNRCKQCHRKKSLSYYYADLENNRAKNRNRRRPTAERRNEILKYYYGITEEQYNTQLQHQNALCMICHKPEYTKGKERLAVDHNHKTGQVRDLLCSRCNKTLGLVGESIEVLETMIAYIKKWNNG